MLNTALSMSKHVLVFVMFVMLNIDKFDVLFYSQQFCFLKLIQLQVYKQITICGVVPVTYGSWTPLFFFPNHYFFFSLFLFFLLICSFLCFGSGSELCRTTLWKKVTYALKSQSHVSEILQLKGHIYIVCVCVGSNGRIMFQLFTASDFLLPELLSMEPSYQVYMINAQYGKQPISFALSRNPGLALASSSKSADTTGEAVVDAAIHGGASSSGTAADPL